MFKSFFYNIYALLLGLVTVFKHSFKKKVTGKYPETKPNIPERFRGQHQWDMNKCCCCHICEKSCPAGAIKISKDKENNLSFKIDLKKCIFCGNCMYYCHNNAISMSNKFNLATDKSENLMIEINSLNSNIKGNKIEDN